MSAQWINILACLTLCYGAWGFFYLVLHRRGIDYTHRYGWTTAYFLLAGLLIALPFRGYIAEALQGFAATPLVVLCIFMLGQLALYWCLPLYLAEPKEYFVRYPDRYYLKIEPRRLISKSADILAQQVFIVLFVLFLKHAGLPLYQILPAFGLLFAFLHIPLIVMEWGAWPARAFAGAVVAFSIIFPVLILMVPYGFIYNMLLHWLFYTVMAAAFWVCHHRKAAYL